MNPIETLTSCLSGAMKFSWQLESYKIEKASSSTSYKRSEKTPHWWKLACLFCSCKWLQVAHGSEVPERPDRSSSSEADRRKDCVFQGSQHISFSLFRRGLHGTISLILYTAHGASFPFYGKELREVKWFVQGHPAIKKFTTQQSAPEPVFLTSLGRNLDSQWQCWESESNNLKPASPGDFRVEEVNDMTTLAKPVWDHVSVLCSWQHLSSCCETAP